MYRKMGFNVGVVIVCAGEGKRLGGADKAILSIKGEPLFYHAFKAFRGISRIKQIVFVLRRENLALAEKLFFAEKISEKTQRKKIFFVEGGKERRDSVYNGLLALSEDVDYVLIHDGARPFVSKKIILSILKELKKHPAVICGIKCTDTLKLAGKDFIKKTIKRDNIFFAQTPQGFKKSLLLEAYNKFKKRKFTDDAQALEFMGRSIKIIEGSILNFKITYSEDVLLAKAFMGESKKKTDEE